ncbi:MAG: glycosyltransferase family 4 protein [Acidobacteriota bacterium]
MRILFFTHYFPPEVNAPANRTHEHCREWVLLGHEVHVVTCIPSHPIGKPFPGFRRQWYQYERVDGIHVHRVWTYLAPNRGVLRRTLNYLSFIPTAAFRALRLGRFDIAVGTSPQFFCAVATWVYTRFRRDTPWVFELRDLWPESIPAVGAMRLSFPLRLLERLELRMYRDAAAVVCVTQGFVRALAARGVDPGKLYYVPNGIVPAFWQSPTRADERTKLRLDEADVLASYVGTIGMAHGLSTVLEAASQLRTAAPHVKILIVGDGAELDSLRARSAREGLSNVHFTGLVARGDVAGILAATDVALVTLKPSEVFKTVLPSKMFEAMAAGCAILLAVDGEARATLDRAGAGVFVPPGDAAALGLAIAGLAADRSQRERLGHAGTEFVAREFSRHAWAARYAMILVALVETSGDAEPVAAAVPLK